MALFSERHNIVPKKAILLNDVTDEMRIGIWNAFYKTYCSIDMASVDGILPLIWENFLKFTLDRMPPIHVTYFSQVKTAFLSTTRVIYDWPWWKVFDFAEFVIQHEPGTQRKNLFRERCNLVLERESSGYRFIGDTICPIVSEEEINSIEELISTSSDQVQTHLKQALKLLSDRQSPDFRNSIKESISAIEAQCKIICEEPTPTLTKSLEIIQRRGRVKIHSHLNEAFQKIYSWTNDDGGIRHALSNEPTIDREDAQFMLIVCSAFVNYLIVKKVKSES